MKLLALLMAILVTGMSLSSCYAPADESTWNLLCGGPDADNADEIPVQSNVCGEEETCHGEYTLQHHNFIFVPHSSSLLKNRFRSFDAHPLSDYSDTLWQPPELA